MSETPAVARELSLEFAIDEAPEKLLACADRTQDRRAVVGPGGAE